MPAKNRKPQNQRTIGAVGTPECTKASLTPQPGILQIFTSKSKANVYHMFKKSPKSALSRDLPPNAPQIGNLPRLTAFSASQSSHSSERQPSSRY
jgi:hypothetical protein